MCLPALSVDRNPVLLTAICGVACHALFNRLEPRRISLILSLLIVPPTLLSLVLHPSRKNIITSFLTSYVVYIGSLICSVVVYRLSPLHPLAVFPGPTICKITRLWACYVVHTGNQHRYYRSLHARYGTHVRTGPNHVHITDATALPAVMGTKHFIRGDRYDVTKLHGTTGSLLSIRDPHEHAQRRRIWDQSMNTSAVQGYRDLLSARVTQLLGIFEKLQDEDVDLSSWLSCFSFDFMGDLAFGGAFRLMEQGSDVDGYMRLSRLGARYQEMVGTVPWVKPFQPIIPGKKAILSFRQFSKASVLARKDRGSSRKDIFYYLLDEDGVGTDPPSLPTLILESGLAIVAGSDTTGTTMSNLFYYLLSNPDILARLQVEVDSAFSSSSEDVPHANVAELKLLNAVINETLRLQPAVPNGIQRVLPSGAGGVMVAGRWIPEGTTVQIPAYSVHRDPQYFFPDPDGFRPDRWLDENSEYKLDHSAYFPFSYGPTGCAGKNLALLELRTVVCSLLHRFDFEFAAHWDPSVWEKNLVDYFILVKGELPVRVKVRK